MRRSRTRGRVMDIADICRRTAERFRGEGRAMRLPVLAVAAMLVLAGTAEAGGRHHRGHGGGGDAVAWFALGSLVTFLSVAYAHPAPAPRPHRPRHAHGHQWHAHGLHLHPHGIQPRSQRHHRNSRGVYRHRQENHGYRYGDLTPRNGHHTPRHRHRHRHRRPAPGPRFLSNRHRHGSGAWHVHSLDRPRAHHRH